jgi:hypothetical protein
MERKSGEGAEQRLKPVYTSIHHFINSSTLSCIRSAMNKALGLVLASLFLLSMVVGVVGVQPTQAATGNPQTYIVPIDLPYVFAVVITNVNLGNNTATIAHLLNETFNNTQLTLTISNSTYQFNVAVNGNASTTYVNSGDETLNALGIYYSPAAQAVVMVFNLTSSKGCTYPALDLVSQVLQATGIALTNSNYSYLISAYAGGQKVYVYETVNMTSAGVLTFYNNTLGQYQTLAESYPYNHYYSNPSKLAQYNYTVQVTVSSKVYTPSGPITAPSASLTLFGPVSIVNIYNPMMNDQPVGWGRSLINVTVYNPLASSTANYVFQLNFTGPGPLTVKFLPAVQIFSADQLANLKPVVGSYEFTGSNQYTFYYTIVILTTSQIQSVTEYYSNGAQQHIPLPAGLPVTVNYNLAGTHTQVQVDVYAFAFVYGNGNNQIHNIDLNGVIVPVITVPVNPASTELEISTNGNPIWETNGYEVNSQNIYLNIQPQLQLTPITVTMQLSATSYEEVPKTAFTSLGNNQYSGFLLTTPPVSNGITATYYLTGNSTIYSTTALTYVNALGTMKFVQNGNFKQLNNNYQQVDALSVEGVIMTPAYPSLNGTAFTGLVVNVETYTQQENGMTYDEVETNVYANTLTGLVQINQNLLQVNGQNVPTVLGNIPYIFSGGSNAEYLPYYGTITPHSLSGSISVPNNLFYQALVDLGLWSNQTVVYVDGWILDQHNNVLASFSNLKYFVARVIPPSVSVSNVNPSSLTCNNYIWVNFYSPDDVLTTGYYNGQYAWQSANNIPSPYNNNGVSGAELGTINNLAPNVQIGTGNSNYFAGGQYISASTNNLGNLWNTITNYLGLSNWTEQSGVPGGMNITTSPSFSWVGPAPGTIVPVPPNQPNTYFVYVPDVLPSNNSATGVPTPNFNISVYVRYQFYMGMGANGKTINPGIYYGPQNTFIIILPPNMTVGTKITFWFATGDYAVHYYFNKLIWNRTVTITIPNATLTIKAPSVVPLYQTTVPIQVIEPYYAAPYPAQLSIGTNTVTLVANFYTLLGAKVSPNTIGVGKIVSVTVTFSNGTTEKVLLTGNNVTALFQSGVFNENGSCTGAYNATLSVTGLMSVLHLTSVSQLNGATLTITYHDNITNENASVEVRFGGYSAVAPVAPAKSASIFYILTARFTNATFGTPVTLAQSVAVQPYVSLNDTFLAKSLPGTIANLQVINVTIIDHYGNVYSIYYNSANGQTIVATNGVTNATYQGNLLPTIPETAPSSGVFNGTPINLVISEPGKLYSNHTAFNGTLAVNLGGNTVPLGPATNFAMPVYSFAGKLFGYNSTMYITVQDPLTGKTATLKTYITAYNITPIRIAPVPEPVPWPNANKVVEYVNNSYVLTPTNQYIVINVTSIVNYSYPVFIVVVVSPGKNSQTAPLLVNFEVAPPLAPGMYYEVPVQLSQIGALSSGYYTVRMFVVPFAGGPVISLYPAQIVFTNVYINTTPV